jgi:hypothetical protein
VLNDNPGLSRAELREKVKVELKTMGNNKIKIGKYGGIR